MSGYDFWKSWQDTTAIERKAIHVVKKVRAGILQAIPQDAIVAIYIKGSFARREMKQNSDIDIVPIVTENRYQSALFNLNTPAVTPAIIVPLSLPELKKNKLWTKAEHNPDLRAKPDRFLKKIKECKLIYGNPLNPDEFPLRDNLHALQDEIQVIKNGYIPCYEKKKISFDPLLKEIFWLVELEQNLLGKKVNHSFAGIAASVKNKDHVIHTAFALRKKHSLAKEKRCIVELKHHLQQLRLQQLKRKNAVSKKR